VRYADLDASMTPPGGEALGGVISPEEYLRRLPEIADALPPHPSGCTREIALRPGTVLVTCRDLTATRVPTDCRG